MKKNIKVLVVTICMLLLSSVAVWADSKPMVMEVLDNTGTGAPVVYVKNIAGKVESASALVENTKCDKVSCDTFEDGTVTLDTLILIDNSLSIPEDSRAELNQRLLDFIADRKPYERFSIATYGEKMEPVIDFTDSYADLKLALENITYINRETYLTDVLYDLVDSDTFKENNTGAYRRIIVASDGVDNKDVGVTSGELIDYLKKSGLPVYGIGIYNSKKSNGDELSKMFSISRATNASSAILGTADVANFFTEVKNDRQIVRFIINVEEELKDGTEKTVKLAFTANGSEYTVTTDHVRMDQVQQIKEEPPVEEPPAVDDGKDDIKARIEEFVEEYRIYIIYGGAFAAVLIILLVIYIITNNKKKNQFPGIDPIQLDNMDEPTVVLDNEQTTILDGGGTMGIMPMNQQCRIKLQNINAPAFSYEMSFNGRVTIGKSARKGAMMVLENDKSISGIHCAIEREGADFIIKDLNSTNGTYLNDERVTSSGKVITSGQVIKLGMSEYEFQVKY